MSKHHGTRSDEVLLTVSYHGRWYDDKRERSYGETESQRETREEPSLFFPNDPVHRTNQSPVRNILIFFQKHHPQ
jgi:hypothetical protein